MPRAIRKSRRDFLGRVRSGSLCLVLASCLLPFPNCRTVAADNRDGFLAQSLDAFVQKQEASLKAARDKALKSIVDVRKRVKTYKLTHPSLEKRLDGRPDLKNSGLWKGNAINSEGWLLAGVQLTLYEAADGSIEANMRRIHEDTPLAGSRTGRLIDIQTPHPERRAEQLLGIRGYLVGRRFIATVKGFDEQREWKTAWINLTQEQVSSLDLERIKSQVTQRRRNELQRQKEKEKDLERQKSKESKDAKANKKRSTKRVDHRRCYLASADRQYGDAAPQSTAINPASTAGPLRWQSM